jgi:hypothetical protein
MNSGSDFRIAFLEEHLDDFTEIPVNSSRLLWLCLL